MAEPETDALYWYDPDPRAILPLEQLHISRSLRRTLRQQPFEIRFDSAFAALVELCAAPAPGREQTWLSSELIALYVYLHAHGFAHSVECWQAGHLVGGVYGVSIGGFFAGESMVSRARNSSKVALVHLVWRLRAQGYQLFDVQFQTPHLARFGVCEIPRADYHRRLAQALPLPVQFL